MKRMSFDIKRSELRTTIYFQCIITESLNLVVVIQNLVNLLQ